MLFSRTICKQKRSLLDFSTRTAVKKKTQITPRIPHPLHPPRTFVTKVCVQKDDYNEQRNEIKTQPKAEIIKETSKTLVWLAQVQWDFCKPD